MSTAKILIVDDDVRISSLVHTILERSGGYTVLEENRPFAAKETARGFRPDLVLMDVDMPGKDGGMLAAEFAADPVLHNVPVLFVTSLITQREGGSGPTIRNGSMFLSKPVAPAVLLETVRGILQGAVA